MRREKQSAKKNGERGFTIMELIIAMSIFLIGIAAVYGALRMATIQKNSVNTRTDQMRSARIALEYLRRDAVNAGSGYHRTGGNIPDNAGNGLFGIPSDSDSLRDFLTSIIAGNNLTTNSLNFGAKTDTVAFVSRDAAFNTDITKPAESGRLIYYTAATASGNSVNLTTTTANGGVSSCNPFDLYLIEPSASQNPTQIIAMASSITQGTNTIQLATGTANDPFGLNQSATGTGLNQNLLMQTTGGGTIKRINLISYSVTANGVLVRRQFGNQTGKGASEQIDTRELVYGVSDFQVKYFLEDGSTVDDPSNGNAGTINQQNMNSVVQLQISITLAADTDGNMNVSTPITIKEYISTKNLRYASS